MADQAAADSPAAGTLRLNPNLPIPKAVSALDIHLMPGCFHTEYLAEDVAVGAVYAHGTKVLSGALKMGRNPGKGGVADSIGHYLKLKYPDFNPKRILDLGCTIGSNLFPYHDVYPDAELYGVDVAAPCLRYAHARAVSRNIKAHLFQQNAERLSFEDNTFDLVVSSFFFHELSVVATQRVLAECHRILKPGGMMVQMELPATSQVDAFYNFVLDWDNEHNNEPDYRDFRSQNFYALMTGAGFAHGDCFYVSIPDASEEHFRQVALGEAPPPKHGNYTSWRLFGATKTG